MGFADYIEQRGRQQGMQQGMQQNQKKTILVLLKKTNDPAKVAELLEITPEEVKSVLENEGEIKS